jgi:hypothetical protein
MWFLTISLESNIFDVGSKGDHDSSLMFIIAQDFSDILVKIDTESPINALDAKYFTQEENSDSIFVSCN